MTINKIKDGTSLTVSVEGRLDTLTYPELEKFLLENLEGVTDLVFDFVKLDYISSAGLRVLLSTQKKMNKAGTMVVKNINDDIREIFDITGFSDILTIE